MKIYDISRPISETGPVYPGNAGPKLIKLKTFKQGGSNLGALHLGLHTASHIDAPLHYLNNGQSIDKITLEKFIGWVRVIDCTKVKLEIGEAEIKQAKPKAGEIIFFKTKNSLFRHNQKFNPSFIHIDFLAARALIKAKVKAVGIDGPSIRKFRLKPDVVHPILLRAGIPIYEGLDFSKVKAGGYFFVGLPLKIVGAEASPVRAILIR